MPSQLLSRLKPFLNQDIRAHIMSLRNVARTDTLGPVPTNPPHPNKPATNTKPHWPDGHFGDEIDPAQSIIVHGTGGWPSHASATSFRNLYNCTDYWDWSETQGWFDKRGIGPQCFVDPNGTAYSLIGPENFVGKALVTWHAEEMNGLSVGIENSDVADSGAGPLPAGNAKYWSPLSSSAEDLTGLKAYVLLYPSNDPDAAIFWSAVIPHYQGAGDLNAAKTAVNTEFSGWKNMLFTERNYRALATLCRLLSESLGIPKNLPLYPYLTRAHDCRSDVLFRRMLLADPICDAIATTLGTTTDAVRANDDAYRQWYHGADYVKTYRNGDKQNRNNKWTQYFGISKDLVKSTPCFKGLISHAINGDHPCPGPLFDWYRLGREIWDWWWYPFDIAHPDNGSVTVATIPRPYRAARRDTPVIDYYYDAFAASSDYDVVREKSNPPQPYPDRFVIDATTPIYAVANGIIVAAHIPTATDPANPGFLLTRHEVYWRTLAGTGDRPIHYDQPPTIVWSLVTYLASPGVQFNQIATANPEWLNRVIVRAKECQLFVDFWNTNILNGKKPFLKDGVSYSPPREAFTVPTGEQVNLDGDAYTALLTGLTAGTPQLFPLESGDATPIRALLGDFIGLAGELTPATTGVQIEIFSKEKLDVPGAMQRTTSAHGTSWYTAATAALRHEDSQSDLPADGNAWHYPVMSFLDWLNPRTWKSEWTKYGLTATDGSPVPAPPRPNHRISP